MAIVGPGAIETVTEERGSILDGASELEYVTVLNPLTDDFAVRVGQTRPVNLPYEIKKNAQTVGIQSETDVQRTYGVQLKNPDHQGAAHITNTVVIEAGKTKNFVGSEAQVAVRQITNELMQREGNVKLLSDPALRREAENRIIVKRGTVEELMGGSFSTPQRQAVDALNRSNEVQTNDETTEFPGLRTSGDREQDQSSPTDTPPPTSDSGSGAKKIGRPKKSE